MDRALAEKIISDAGGVLDEWSYESNFADLFWSYRLLLQREPEFWDNATYKRRCEAGLRTFVQGFIGSPEFRDLWRIGEDARIPLPDVAVLTERNGFRYWFNMRDRAIGHIIAKGCYEAKETELVSKFVKPGMICLDVGANLGYFSLLMGRLAGREGRVYAMEPFPANYDLLVRNIEENGLRGVVTPYKLAAFDKNGSGDIYFRADEMNDNFGSMFLSEAPQQSDLSCTRVTRARLDDVLPPAAVVDIAKIDVEGAEVHCLRGMSRILEASHPALVVELNEVALARNGSTAEDLIGLLEGAGYIVMEAATQSKFVLPARKSRDPYAFTNLFCRYGG